MRTKWYAVPAIVPTAVTHNVRSASNSAGRCDRGKAPCGVATMHRCVYLQVYLHRYTRTCTVTTVATRYHEAIYHEAIYYEAIHMRHAMTDGSNLVFDALRRKWYGHGYGYGYRCGYGHGMVWYGMVWYGMVWYGMVWYGMTSTVPCS